MNALWFLFCTARAQPAAPPPPPSPAQAPAAEAPVPDAGAEPPVDPSEPPPPWTPSSIPERFVERLPLLGPWPDGWRPEDDGHAGLPSIDVLLGDILDPGQPYGAGPFMGPTLDDLGSSPIDDEAAPGQGDSTPSTLPATVPTPTSTAPTASDSIGEPVSAVAVAAPPAAPHALHPTLAPADDLLPPPPGRGLGRALQLAFLALLALTLAGSAEHLQARVRATGFVPRLLSTVTGLGRASFVPLVFLSLLAVLPPAWGVAIPFALVAVAVATGWSARSLLADIFAGFVLTVERRVRLGDRIDLGENGPGVVQAMGLRAICLRLDDGTLLTVPNHRLAGHEVRVDPDSTPIVVVHLPDRSGRGTVETVELLHELILLQPWLAPGRAPHVERDPKHPDHWRIEARIIDHRHAGAFRLGLIGLWEREAAGRKAHSEAL